ncbi:MAG: hypothetical protein JWO98_4025 [Frankiales bacterium]|nr:hypothetical protein [Frankiales bacterium]
MASTGLPGHQGEQYLAERRALRAAEDVLLAAGCKVVEVPSTFDDGLDLFVALTNDNSVEPYMAAVQVKGGSSHHRRIAIGNHRIYWRDHTLPVFGVVHDGELGYWADLTQTLNDETVNKETQNNGPGASVATTEPLDMSFPAAVREACERRHAIRDLLDLLSDDVTRQVTAVVAARSLPRDPRVARLLRMRLTQLHRAATSLALEHLVRLAPDLLAREPFDAALLDVLLTRLWSWDTDDFREPGLKRLGTREAARTSMRHLYECLIRQVGAAEQLRDVYRTTDDPNIAYLSGHLLAAVYTEWDLPFDEVRVVLTSVDRWAHTFETVELLSAIDEGGVEFDI